MTRITDQERGLYGKYRVERIAGTPGKHDECWYYVLDRKHDPFAIPALRAYADACEDEYPELARDLRRIADGDDPWLVYAQQESGPLNWPSENDR